MGLDARLEHVDQIERFGEVFAVVEALALDQAESRCCPFVRGGVVEDDGCHVEQRGYAHLDGVAGGVVESVGCQ